jgi:hypothetical protein
MRHQVDNCAYLNLREICEPEENSLRLVVEEMRVGDITEDLVVGSVNLGPTRRIEHTEACRVFEISWNTYIAYCVVNESYALGDKADVSEGRRFRVYSKSRFLDYVRKDTFGDDQYPGPSKHIGISCENHIVNVISVSEPSIRLLKAGQPRVVPDA